MEKLVRPGLRKLFRSSFSLGYSVVIGGFGGRGGNGVKATNPSTILCSVGSLAMRFTISLSRMQLAMCKEDGGGGSFFKYLHRILFSGSG